MCILWWNPRTPRQCRAQKKKHPQTCLWLRTLRRTWQYPPFLTWKLPRRQTEATVRGGVTGNCSPRPCRGLRKTLQWSVVQIQDWFVEKRCSRMASNVEFSLHVIGYVAIGRTQRSDWTCWVLTLLRRMYKILILCTDIGFFQTRSYNLSLFSRSVFGWWKGEKRKEKEKGYRWMKGRFADQVPNFVVCSLYLPYSSRLS